MVVDWGSRRWRGPGAIVQKRQGITAYDPVFESWPAVPITCSPLQLDSEVVPRIEVERQCITRNKQLLCFDSAKKKFKFLSATLSVLRGLSD